MSFRGNTTSQSLLGRQAQWDGIMSVVMGVEMIVALMIIIMMTFIKTQERERHPSLSASMDQR